MIQNEMLRGGREGKIFKQADSIVRPANPWTRCVHDFLNYLLQQGFDCIPHPLGMTEDGREIVSYVEGVVHNDGMPEAILTDEVLVSVAKLLRRYHDIGAGYIARLTGDEPWMLPARWPAEVMCHGDFAPYNITFVDEKVQGIIDFDTLHPGPRLWDIAYAAYRWVPFVAPTNPDYRYTPEEQIRRLKLFADAYGMTDDERRQLPEMMIARVESLVAYMRNQAVQGNEDVIRNIADGHLDLYLNDIAYFKEHARQVVEGIENKS